MGKSSAPEVSQQQYDSAAEKTSQTGAQINRPNQSNAFGGNVSWTQGPNGEWSQKQSFGGPMGGLANNLQNQAANFMGQPMNWDQFGQAGTGDQARDQAISAAYNQSASRLNPQWNQREDQMRSRLANSGLDPNSAAARGMSGQFNQARNDAYGSAMNSAIGQGAQAGHMAFGDNMMARQQAISDALRKRGMPMDELGMMQKFLAMPGFQGAAGTDYSGALNGHNQYNMDRIKMDNENASSVASGITSAVGGAAMMMSDRRSKQNIKPLGHEAMPGVPFVSFEYRHDPGTTHVGVIAQDLEKVAPKYVHEREDGMKMVDYSFLDGVSNE